MSTRQNKGRRDLDRRLGELTVGDFLRTWRVSEEMSLRAFGERVGLSVANLCDIEKGRKGISPGKAEQIANAIGVPPSLLVRLALQEQLKGCAGRYKADVKPAA